MKLRTLLEANADQSIIDWLSDENNVKFKTINGKDVKFSSKSKKFKIEGNLVSTECEVTVLAKTIPFKFQETATFTWRGPSDETLTSMKGCPEIINGQFYFYGNAPLNDAPKEIKNAFFCGKMKSLKDIHKYIKKCKRVQPGPALKKNVLGVILIEGIEEFYVDSVISDSKQKMAKIVSKYLGQGLKGVAQAQRELLTEDFDDFADL